MYMRILAVPQIVLDSAHKRKSDMLPMIRQESQLIIRGRRISDEYY